MSKSKYIYIDDVNDSSTEAIKDGLADTEIIDVDFLQVKDFTEQIISFEKELKIYDGIILDLRLDGNLHLGVKYTAPALAQELRSRSAAKEGIKDTPIILCSTDEKISALYEKDQTSHDLFDYIFLKENPFEGEIIAQKLSAISKGYYTINKNKKNLKNIFNRDISSLDQRIFGKFINREIIFPTHELAQHILKEIIGQPGPLINDLLVAARLGVDIEKSPDWQSLLDDFFESTIFSGVFSDGWNRWWFDLVIDRFKELTNKRLSALNASERVNLLIDNCKLQKLVAAEPIKNSVSSNYWTICEFYKKPLDPLEGFKVYSFKEPKPWQEDKYLSFEAAAERRMKIHPSETERLNQYKKRFTSK